jgi:FMN phosphatase YigB (HAD superfamily)
LYQPEASLSIINIHSTTAFSVDIDSAGKYALSDMERIQAIIFDWGGVLIEDPAPGVVRYCAKALGISEEDYRRAGNLYMNDFQTGLVTEQQFWLNMTSYLNARLGEAGGRSRVPMPKNVHRRARGDRREKHRINSAYSAVSAVRSETGSLWGDAFASAYVPRRELFTLAARLHNSGCKTAILSNTEKPAVELFHKQKYDMFDVEVFSCLEGTKKPERKIYEITLDRLRTPADQTLFIDNKQDFIDGAKQAGLEVILFKNVNQLKTDLAEAFGRTDDEF